MSGALTKWFEVRDADGRAIFRVEANYETKELCIAPSEAWCPASARDRVVACLDAACAYLDAAEDVGPEVVYLQSGK